MRRLVLLIALLAAAGGAVAAQDPDTTRPQAQALRQRIEERFAQRVQEQLGLSDEQAAKLRVTSHDYGERRRKMEARERDLRVALTGQLRPGVAANEDSVARLTKALVPLPELELLDPAELDSLLQRMEMPSAGSSTLDAPGLGDLEDTELEQVLDTWEG